MEKKFGIYLFYAFIVIGIISFPGVFMNFWFAYISTPLCILWTSFFVLFLCLRALLNFFAQCNGYETTDDYLELLGEMVFKEKIIISDDLVIPFQLAFEPFSTNYYICLYKHVKNGISVLIITTSLPHKNCLKDLFEKVSESDNELIVDSGCVFVFSSGNIKSITINNSIPQNNSSKQYYFLHDAYREKSGIAVYPEYGDGTYFVANRSVSESHSILVELIPGSIERIRCT